VTSRPGIVRTAARGVWALALALLAASLGALSGAAAHAASPLDAEGALERQVKAAFLYQFIPYVQWPASAFDQPDSPVIVAVAGPEAIVAELADVIGRRSAQDRPVVVRRWRESDEQGGAHVVYVTRFEAARLSAIARAAQATGTLVVSESENALNQGSMINFRLVDGRVRFDVALAPAEKAGLRISSRLLTVAQAVRPAPN
jgi:hypothetical protein